MTLTEAVYYIRKIVPMAILGGIFLVILFILFKIVELSRPETSFVATPTAAPAYGQLQPPNLKEAQKAPKNITYTMNTIEGVPLTATTSARIYFVPKKSPGLSFREKAGVIAKALNFEEGTTTSRYDQSTETYTLVDRAKRLIVDIDTFNYTYTQDFDLETKKKILDVKIPTEEIIKSKAQDIVRSLGRYPPDIAQGTQAISYIAYKEASGSAQTTADVVQDPRTANMVSVEIFPAKINELNAVTESYVSSPNRVIFIPQEADKDFVVKAQIKVFEKQEDQFSVYPLKTGVQALQDLRDGKAWIVQGGNYLLENSTIGVTSMQTAYLVPDAYTQYIQPVYVFIGDNNFIAYVPAILDTWMQPIQWQSSGTVSPDNISPTSRPTPSTIYISPSPGITFIPIHKNN